MKKRVKGEERGRNRLIKNLKTCVFLLLLLISALAVYSFAEAAVSHTPNAIQPQGTGSGLDADKLQALTSADLKQTVGWTISGANVITTAAGSVGIGINPPAEKLHVTGKIRSDTGLCIGTSCITSWSQVG